MTTKDSHDSIREARTPGYLSSVTCYRCTYVYVYTPKFVYVYTPYT
jgi:hypothetical protein